MTHADFSAGMRNETIACFLGEPYQLLKGARLVVFTFLAMLYMTGPLVIIPLWAYHVGDWWLLFGIVFSYIGSRSAGKYSNGIFLFGCYCIGFWIHNGVHIHHYTTFYFLCAALAYMTWHLADTIRTGCARQSLIDSSEVFYAAVSQNRLMIVPVDSSQNLMWTAEQTSEIMGRSLLQLKSHLTVLVICNIFARAFEYVFGFFTALVCVVIANAKGIDNLSSHKADSIMRQFKSGTVGAAVLALGYFGPYSVYGLILAAFWVCAVIWYYTRAKTG